MFEFVPWYLVAGLGLAAIVAFVGFLALTFRRVVPTNEVHIVQSRKATTSFGKGFKDGNTYYQWPSWVPGIGVLRSHLPLSIWDVEIKAYDAYDKGRLPFLVDVVAFFRIEDSNMAAARVSGFEELESQMQIIVRGAIRSILSKAEIDEIMQERSRFGEEFTFEVKEQIASWGVVCVKNVELMDVRDTANTHVIQNIMEKKKSHIEMESRQEVAKNHRMAEISEIEADREVELQRQVAQQQVGLRTVENKKMVALANEAQEQEVKEQQRATKEKEMAIRKVEETRQAEIQKEVQVVKATQEKETQQLIAEGKLEAKRREAEGIELEGVARAEAEKQLQLASVQAQTELAEKVGSNKEYQQYMVTIRQVEAFEAIGIEQAKSLEKAQIKIIANSETPASGIQNVMDLFSAKGGARMGAALEALTSTLEEKK